MYSQSIVILSSRPAATQRFRRRARVWIEVVGFMKEQVYQYINCYFEEKKEKSISLITHLENHQNLVNLCYLPLHCAVLVHLYNVDATLPETETEFYQDFTLSLLVRSIRKHTNLRPPIIKSLDSLPTSEQIVFYKVCKLAFKATLNSRQVFKERELKDICFNNSSEDNLGLVVVDCYFAKSGTDETYTFLHLTLQEYLAALFVSRLSESEQISTVATYSSQRHLYVTLRFLFGILDYSKDSTKNLFKLMMDATKHDYSHHIQCAHESCSATAYTDVENFHASLEDRKYYDSALQEGNFHADLEDQKYYESALREGIPVTMQYLKFLFFGPPRTGKSTARRRLVQEIVNLSSLGEPLSSTGMAEASDVIIKKLTCEPAAISGSQWRSMKRSKEGEQPNVYSEGDYNYLAQVFYRLISKTERDSEMTITVPATVSEPALSDSESDSEKSSKAKATDIVEPSGPYVLQEKLNLKPKLQAELQAEMPVELQCERACVLLTNSEEKEIGEAFKKLKIVLQSDNSEDLRKLLKDLTILNVVDIGGQPAFLELCPAFTTGPALYLLFFRLDQELKKKYPIKFQSADEETILEYSYCTETVIHQTLSSLACFETHSTDQFTQSASSPSVTGRALLFGTYKDKVDDEHISQMNTTLQEQLEHTKLYEENLLLRASEDKLFYSLNNLTGDDSEMSPIREDIEKIIYEFFPPVPIPASWLMFRIILHFLQKSVVSISQCEMIAGRLLMRTPVREAIRFFHHKIGSLMHYPDIPSMKDIVVCNSQVVFDSTSELIIDTFKIKNRSIPQTAVKDFYEKGQFSLAHIKDRTVLHRKNQLSLEQLVDLLKSHNIIAEIKPDQESSAQCQPKFIMPAILKEASEKELKVLSFTTSSEVVPPLFIHFVSGFVPFGVFCASIARLLAHQHSMSPIWKLCDGPLMKNKVRFCIDKSFYATLISRPQYLEIRVERHPRARSKFSLQDICSTVRQTVVNTLETVINKMKYKSHAKIKIDHSFESAFICCLDESHSDHLMKVDKDEDEYFGECLKDHVNCDLKTEYLVWFSQIEQYTKSNSSAPQSIATRPPSTVTQKQTTAFTDGSETSTHKQFLTNEDEASFTSLDVKKAVKRKSDEPHRSKTARKMRKVVNSSQITDPDPMFNELAFQISDKYLKVGVELGLQYLSLWDELETSGAFASKKASEKAMKMLKLWQQSVDKDHFTYSALATALEKHGLQCASYQFCYTEAICNQ